MFLFSPQSLANLKTCHPELQVLFFEVIKHWDCTIIEGYRNEKAQEEAFSLGNSKLHYPFGKHNSTPSMAVDVAPYPIDWKDIEKFKLFASFVRGVASIMKSKGIMKYGLRWGGAWNGEPNTGKVLNDLVHFELKE